MDKSVGIATHIGVHFYATAMGLLSIVSDINGCNDIIIEEQNGTTIIQGNVKIDK